MKPLLATVLGFVLSMGMFAGGAVLATYVVTAEPVAVQAGPTQDVAALWTAEPRAVDREAQDLERVAAAPLPPEPKPAAETEPQEVTMASADPMAWSEDETLDPMTTSAISPEPQLPADQQGAAKIPAKHVRWCSDRYRSYRVETNSYTPYSGGQRTCVSPYLGEGETSGEVEAGAGIAAQATISQEAPVAEATSSATGRYVEMASSHIQSCFDRYRSYRPEDNTYQPYGGGPRQQCR